MTSDAPTRQTTREILAAGLEAKCVTSTSHAQAVYDYQKADFGTESPVIVVTSASSARNQQVFGGWVEAQFDYDVHLFVLYAGGTLWTEADSEDRLDLLEKEVGDWILDNQGGTLSWDFRATTVIQPVAIGGEEYRHEIIPVRATIT